MNRTGHTSRRRVMESCGFRCRRVFTEILGELRRVATAFVAARLMRSPIQGGRGLMSTAGKVLIVLVMLMIVVWIVLAAGVSRSTPTPIPSSTIFRPKSRSSRATSQDAGRHRLAD